MSAAIAAVAAGAAGISQAAYQELQEILADRGSLHPADVVSRARNADSALHRYFEWNSRAAHEKYLLHQARQLIMRVTVEYPSGHGQEHRVRAYVALREDRGGYRSLTQVQARPAAYMSLLQQAKADADSFLKKYRQLAELAPARKPLQDFIRDN